MKNTAIRDIIEDNNKLLCSAYQRVGLGITFPRICRLVYLLYPDLFLHGVTVKDVFFCINQNGDLSRQGPHHPGVYDRGVLVSFLRELASVYAVSYDEGLIGLLLLELEEDFSQEYLDAFPHVIRVVTGNGFKRKEYSSGFGKPGVEFLTYEFVEIQGGEDTIIDNKLSQVPPVYHDEVVVVDDTSLSMTALDGFPGPYVKPFFAQSDIKSFGEKLNRLGSNEGLVVHSVGVRFRLSQFILIVKFPIVWGPECGDGQMFNPYCYYGEKPLTALNGWFRHVIAFWIKVILLRNWRSPDTMSFT